MTEVSTESASEPVHSITEAPPLTAVSDAELKVTLTVTVMFVALMVLAVTQSLRILSQSDVCGVALCSVLSVQVNW